MENQNKSDWSKRDVGALWKKEGKNQKYLSGYVRLENGDQEVKIVVFSNRNKNNEKAPDYRIYVSAPSQEENKNSKPQQQKTFVAKSKPVQKVVVEEESEDIL